MKTKNTLLCIGDSLTEGWPYGTNFSWVKNLQKKFANWEIINRGVAGATYADMVTRTLMRKEHLHSTHCFMMGGTNEAWQGVPQPVLKKNFSTLTEIVKGNKLIIGMPPPVIDRPIERYLADIRSWLREEAANRNAFILDFNACFTALEDVDIFSEYYLDGYHPNKKGYTLMGEYAEQALNEIMLQT